MENDLKGALKTHEFSSLSVYSLVFLCNGKRGKAVESFQESSNRAVHVELKTPIKPRSVYLHRALCTDDTWITERWGLGTAAKHTTLNTAQVLFYSLEMLVSSIFGKLLVPGFGWLSGASSVVDPRQAASQRGQHGLHPYPRLLFPSTSLGTHQLTRLQQWTSLSDSLLL